MIYNLDKIIEEEISGVGVHAKYTKPDGTPWATDPHPFWLWLGTWTTSKGNRSIGAINLNKVATRHGEEGLKLLKQWLPVILQNVPIEGNEEINLETEDIENSILDDHILFEAVEARPLKGTGTTLGRWEVGAKYIPNDIIRDIF
ncbi:MAG TPA: hypothetical protein VMW42_08295, partial [Desulfatiglandales bacterium]|nr:hypothetical protein [Desulfatiglandales bacterium]